VNPLSKRIGRLEGPGGGDDIITIPTADGDIVMTSAELVSVMRKINGQSRGLPQASRGPQL